MHRPAYCHLAPVSHPQKTPHKISPHLNSNMQVRGLYPERGTVISRVFRLDGYLAAVSCYC